MKLKHGLFIFLAALCVGWTYYTLHLRRELERVKSDIKKEKELRQFYIHEDRYNRLEITRDSLNQVIESFSPDTIYQKQIIIKYDTITKRVLDSSYVYQLEWYKSELDKLYGD